MTYEELLASHKRLQKAVVMLLDLLSQPDPGPLTKEEAEEIAFVIADDAAH